VIHYLDTSALVKRRVTEPGSRAVRALFRGRGRIAVARITYAEAAAALARRCREGALAVAARDAALAALDNEFAEMEVVETRGPVVRRVPSLVVRHALRAYDAVQLASALELAGRGAAVTFWAGDRALVRCAGAEGLRAVFVG
jgi:predicted nucleic acid-binding protein